MHAAAAMPAMAMRKPAMAMHGLASHMVCLLEITAVRATAHRNGSEKVHYLIPRIDATHV